MQLALLANRGTHYTNTSALIALCRGVITSHLAGWRKPPPLARDIFFNARALQTRYRVQHEHEVGQQESRPAHGRPTVVVQEGEQHENHVPDSRRNKKEILQKKKDASLVYDDDVVCMWFGDDVRDAMWWGM